VRHCLSLRSARCRSYLFECQCKPRSNAARLVDDFAG
jgi:hypothetical protein